MTLLSVIVLDAIGVLVTTAALVEVHVPVTAMSVLDVTVPLCVAVVALPDRKAAVREVVDQETLALCVGSRTRARPSLENHRVDGPALVSCGCASPAARFRAPAEVVLPRGASVNKFAVHEDLDDVVAGPVDKGNYELYRMRLVSLQAAGHFRLHPAIFK